MTDEQSFTDLDALVLAEIESASGARTRRRPGTSSPRRREANGVPGKQERPAETREVARIHGDDRARHNLSGEEAEFLDLPPELAEEEQDELSAPRLFTPEEEAFMHRAVGFLSGRENGDVILGHIWEQLTESHPERFYMPEHESIGGTMADDGMDPGAEQSGEPENGEQQP